ncbi:MAG: NUDIX hydrolase [Clostridiales bacterium]|nr:NUDIX hydrolase [Clostridiales bacterium]
MHETLRKDQLYVTVDILILTEKSGGLKLLLSQRPLPPAQGKWALPGRFVAQEESAEETVRELLAEMLPVRQYYSEQLYTFTQPGRDPRGRVLSVAYLVIVPWQRLQPALEQEGVTLKCFSVSTGESGFALTSPEGVPLSMEELAFDHFAIIRTGVARLQGKIDYTDIGFQFLNTPAAFPLSELQRVFEAVLGKAQDASNFRRFVRGRYEDSGKIAPAEVAPPRGKGRPATLYRWQNERRDRS